MEKRQAKIDFNGAIQLTKQELNIQQIQNKSTSREKAECRICLESQELQKKMIRPCQCIGTLAYVHEQCLSQWVQKKQKFKEGSIICQLCQHKITYKVQKMRRCGSFEQLKIIIEKQVKLFVFLLLMLIIILGFIVFLFTLLAEIDFEDLTKDQLIKLSIISCSILVLLIVIGIFIFVFVKDFVIIKEWKIVNFQENQMNFVEPNLVKILPKIQIIQFQ